MISQLEMPRGEEWIVILVVVILLFGPTKLPGLVRQLGKAKKVWDQELSPSRDRHKTLDTPDQTTSQTTPAPGQNADAQPSTPTQPGQ
ncbi:sec-independent protein translocase protein TatA [Kribbella aluminosa]|uniref:Sec-independent protein translocase protein TatA n=1 Tax=Kribbella aluminosa TaxID=416017 RepID=A0ABS4UJK9_9ACTN|nr:twin-arginine translocase TatA/TatE family subunit [Kribbella aluminosa]MBP2351847.1 sec-independent protein translocase protein TatA [Kribbella aluminosa]